MLSLFRRPAQTIRLVHPNGRHTLKPHEITSADSDSEGWFKMTIPTREVRRRTRRFLRGLRPGRYSVEVREHGKTVSYRTQRTRFDASDRSFTIDAWRIAGDLAEAIAAAGVPESKVIGHPQIDAVGIPGRVERIFQFIALGEYTTPGRRLTLGDGRPVTLFEVVQINDGPFEPRAPKR